MEEWQTGLLTEGVDGGHHQVLGQLVELEWITARCKATLQGGVADRAVDEVELASASLSRLVARCVSRQREDQEGLLEVRQVPIEGRLG